MNREEMPRLRFAHLSQFALLPLLAIGLASCQLPNVRPFADATVELRRTVVSGGEIVVNAQLSTPYVDVQGRVIDPENEQHPARQLGEQWQVRVKAMEVLVAYTDSLDGIVQAGQNADHSTEALASTLDTLGSHLPSLGIGEAVKGGNRLFQLLVNAAKSARAAHDLSKAVEAAHPALAEVARVITIDLGGLKTLHQKICQDRIHFLNEEFGPRNQYRSNLLKMLDEAHAAYIRNPTPQAMHGVESLEGLVNAADRHRIAYEERLSRITSERVRVDYLFDTAVVGVDQWVRAHEEIRIALESKRVPSVRVLLGTVSDLKQALEEFRKAREK